jgi:predicted GNAT superfamily acetyltransferase
MNHSPVPIGAVDLAGTNPLGAALLALNNTHEIELSRLTRERMGDLVAAAFAAWRIGDAEAMLIAFDQDADYDSPNFLWFRERLGRFIYVDRIVVAAGARGRGHARRLYAGLFDLAVRSGHSRVVCEVNSTPPNPNSDALHAALGFTDLGAATSHDGSKTVRYLGLELTGRAIG